MANTLSEFETMNNIISENKVKTIRRRILYLCELIVDITFVLKEIKNGIYYYTYSYSVDGGDDNEEIKIWVDKLVLRKPWDITGNRNAIVL